MKARDKLRQLNEALRPLDFRGDHYQFSYAPTEELADLYDLIVNKGQLLGTNSLFDSPVYTDNRALFEDFFRLLTTTPQSDRDRAERDKLIDYRRYLSYDIEVIDATGTRSRFSKIMGQTSGGESQTPFIWQLRPRSCNSTATTSATPAPRCGSSSLMRPFPKWIKAALGPPSIFSTSSTCKLSPPPPGTL